MIRFDPGSPNIEVAKVVDVQVSEAYADALLLLPGAPRDVTVLLDNAHIVPETGVGGYAKAESTLLISFDQSFLDRDAQLVDLRGTIFHQAYHLAQGHTAEHPRVAYSTALELAVAEGCAIVFEREYGGSAPSWGDYSPVDTATLEAWVEQLRRLPVAQYASDEDTWCEWATDHHAHEEDSWRIYRVGTYLIDHYLRSANGTLVTDLAAVAPSDLISRFDASH